MEQKISEIKKSLEKAVEDLYSVDENISEWDEKCDVEEAIRSISNAIRRLNSIVEKQIWNIGFIWEM